MNRISKELRLKKLVLCVPTMGLLMLSGCGQGDVASYDVAKEAPPVAATPQMGSADPHAGIAMGKPSLTWGEVPPGWTQSTPSSGMRMATFEIAGEAGESAEMAIIPMGGFAGSEEQLVNMWRQQLGLPELDQAEAQDHGAAVSIGDVEGLVYEMSGDADGILTRMLVASANRDGVNFFFKLIGHDAVVASQKDAFLSFLETVDFTAAPPQSMPPPATASAAPTEQTRWSAPESWEAMPPSQFLLAKYRLAGEDGASVQVTVSKLGGSAGGLLPNVNRWRAQMNLAQVDEAGMKPLLSEIKAGSLTATLVTLKGTDLREGTPGKMLTVVVALPAETWFFKMTGPVSLVDARADEFRAFVNASRF